MTTISQVMNALLEDDSIAHICPRTGSNWAESA